MTIFNGDVEKKTSFVECQQCLNKYSFIDNCLDLSPFNEEKKFYDNRYDANIKNLPQKIDIEQIKRMWFISTRPERAIFLNELLKLDLKNKKVLLLGNGISEKELVVLSYGSYLVYSDLSIEAVRFIKRKFEWDEYCGKIFFCSFDASNIPIESESFDIVIGYAFVHHLDELENFFSQVKRVLKPEGVCLFSDDAYSKLWNNLKFSPIGSPFLQHHQNKYGISPEDKRAFLKGGFTYDELFSIQHKLDFSKMIFVRLSFLTYIYNEGIVRLFGLSDFTRFNSLISRILNFFDNSSQKMSKTFNDNTIRLIWGFQK